MMSLIRIPQELLSRDRSPIGLSGTVVELLRLEFPRLHVDVSERWDPEQPENYPAIFVKRADWVPKKTVINDSYQNLIPEDGYSYSFWLPIQANFHIIVVSNDKGEAEEVLNKVFLFLLCSSKVIREQLNFKTFDVLNLSATDVYQKGKDTILGRVDLQILFDFTWKIQKVTPKIERITINEET